jgi:hypothetical protein
MLPKKYRAKRTRNEICLSTEHSEGELFRFPLCPVLFREPEGQHLRGRLSLLTFFGEAKKVSSRRATPGKFVRRAAALT